MSEYKGQEKRKHRRLNVNFVVSYRVKQVPDGYDLSQSKNVSQGGMLLTTNKAFTKRTFLDMSIRFPLISRKIKVTGEVVDSKEIVKNLLYETRIKFLDLEEDIFIKLGEFVEENISNG